MSTPERSGKYSSRLSTPRSRRQSRTPIGTPNRRRATIVSANLVTPRRNRKVTMTPQNTLRMLSRALAREKKQIEESQSNEQTNALSEYNKETKDNEPLEETITPSTQLIDVIMDKSANSKTPEWKNDFYGDGLELGFQTPDYGPSSPMELTQLLSVEKSQIYSDIAIPQGIVPDGAFLLQDTTEDQQLLELPSSQIQYEDNEETQPKPLPQKSKISIFDKSQKNKVSKSSSNNKNLAKFAKSSVHKPLNSESFQALEDTSDLFMEQISYDMKAYTNHAGKKTIDIKTLYLLFKRQRICKSIKSFLELADEMLPLEDVLEIRRNVKRLE